ncbi:hypothetical protein FQA47_018524 [Oryzias melastigma]|uniref:Uncharacterized protein n=1 Tax=Oryzias melastigma TaxID=30732 RepID=A0A834CNA6_ORYME|nr:hypothetical protein FQA47_018524 [Oryzias melastigma]
MIARVRSAADARAAEPPTQERHSQAGSPPPVQRRAAPPPLQTCLLAAPLLTLLPRLLHGSSRKAAPSLRTRPPAAGCQPEQGLRSRRRRRKASLAVPKATLKVPGCLKWLTLLLSITSSPQRAVKWILSTEK